MEVNRLTIIRTILFFVALFNQALAAKGYSPLPFKEEEMTDIISVAFTVITGLWAWWKNNSFTKEAITADKDLEYYKRISR